MGWFSRWRRRERAFSAPPPPDPEDLQRLHRKMVEADKELISVRRRDPEVNGRARNLQDIHRANHLGPKFWDALGTHKPRKAQ